MCQEVVPNICVKKCYKELYQEIAAWAADLQGARELVDLALQVASVSLSAVQLLQALLERLASCHQLSLHENTPTCFIPKLMAASVHALVVSSSRSC